jgi:hypothetical protein
LPRLLGRHLRGRRGGDLLTLRGGHRILGRGCDLRQLPFRLLLGRACGDCLHCLPDGSICGGGGDRLPNLRCRVLLGRFGCCLLGMCRRQFSRKLRCFDLLGLCGGHFFRRQQCSALLCLRGWRLCEGGGGQLHDLPVGTVHRRRGERLRCVCRGGVCVRLGIERVRNMCGGNVFGGRRSGLFCLPCRHLLCFWCGCVWSVPSGFLRFGGGGKCLSLVRLGCLLRRRRRDLLGLRGRDRSRKLRRFRMRNLPLRQILFLCRRNGLRRLLRRHLRRRHLCIRMRSLPQGKLSGRHRRVRLRPMCGGLCCGGGGGFLRFLRRRLFRRRRCGSVHSLPCGDLLRRRRGRLHELRRGYLSNLPG